MFDLNEQYNYNIFEHKCLYDDENELEFFIKKNNIDINFDGGYFSEIICLRDDINLLKMILRNNANIKINNECILRSVAHNGCNNVLNYLLYNCDVNLDILYETTASTNKESTKNILSNFNTTKMLKC